MARKPNKNAAIADSLAHNNAYREMLAEVASSLGQSDEDGRSVKKRRVAGRIITQTPQAPPSQQFPGSVQPKRDDSIDYLFEDVPDTQRPLQQIEQTESEDSADSDVNWEQVDLKQSDDDSDIIGSEVNDVPKGLNLVLQDEKQRASRPAADRRKPITTAEKKLRLVVHKMNVSCLLAHVHIRNHWCNDNTVHAILRRFLTKKMVSYLTRDENATQFQQSRSFMDGLQQASDAFRTHFRVSARGMAKPSWAHPKLLQHMHIPDDIDLPMQKEDFTQAAKDLSASRDVGAQLFCALLRSAGVDARLVCSLQPLPFRTVEKTGTPQQRYAVVIDEPGSRGSTPESDSERTNIRHLSPTTIGSRGGQGRFAITQTPPQLKLAPKRRIRESSNPVYWTEAFSPSVQKWLPLDPLTTNTIAKPSKLCPSSSSTTPLTYAIAFEDDLSAHDVTRRYSRVYNAKTIKDRVESTTNGRAWFKKLMRMFRRPHGEKLDRDQLEQAELSQKEAQEPMPRGVQDFKDHAYYALERHLKRHEVIHPKREVGKVGGAGKGHDKQNLEIVYRRRDVVVVLSADKWYRAHGRVVKPREQPLKHVTARKKNKHNLSDNEDDDDDEEQRLGTALYAITQTDLYAPQPVTADSKIPKNGYGNLDIYHAHMIPPGGAHIHHPETARVARLLGIDHADAITGFSFKGRHGTAVVNGAVVCATHVDAIIAVIEAVEEEKADVALEARRHRAVALWGKLMRGLRVRERIEGYADEDAAADEEEEEEEGGGGFLPDRDSEMATPTATAASPPNPAPPSLSSDDHHLPPMQPPRPPITIVYGGPLPTAPPASADANDGGFLSDHDNVDGAGSAMNPRTAASTPPASPPTNNDDDEDEDDDDDEDDAALHAAIVRSVLDAPDGGRDDGGEGPSGVSGRARGGIEGGGVGGVGEEAIGKEEVDEEGRSEIGSLMSHDPEDEEEEVMEL